MNPCWRPSNAQTKDAIGACLGQKEQPMRKLLNAVLVFLGIRPKTYRFAMPGTKKSIELEGLHCCQCQNAFWVENTALEMPTFCCYCGTKFGSFCDVDNDTFEDARGSTN